jgi:hypothetical protein
MENENIDIKEKEKILSDLHTWLNFLDEHNDIDKLHELSDMMSEWDEGVDWDTVDSD